MHVKELELSAIVAMDENRVIGNQNQLPWRLPADMRHFKQKTTNQIVLMGRKTYQSIGKALPNRINIVVSRNTNFKAQDAITKYQLTDALKTAHTYQMDQAKQIFIIGGAEIYRSLLPIINKIYITIILHTFEGDQFFPNIDFSEWKQTASEIHPANEENHYPYRFLILERINNHAHSKVSGLNS